MRFLHGLALATALLSLAGFAPSPEELTTEQRVAAGLLPDPALTPGDTLDVGVSDICVPGYTKKVRNVPLSVRRAALAEYKIVNPPARSFELDHLISLELGGSNSIKNLWPQSYKTSPWNARVKDRLENYLHGQVCGGKLDLKTAQAEIKSDWIASYKKRIQDLDAAPAGK